MNFTKDEVSLMKIAGLMHDIGKIGIGDSILNNPDLLNKEEWRDIRRHSEIGYRILSSANEFSEIADYILEHHERWDGFGYPKGLKGDQISIQARIIGIADSYDSMTSDRSYRKALSEDEAKMEIKANAGRQFDPEIARIFVEKVLGKEWD
jgi:HD-GYP domain-containing protein (c-di-GMP phosphodiesterase class II)